ncbi:hypothetical protein NE562_16450 [Butyricicoccus faecihominis]|uniref:DUF6774 domain-containing protein n=1 Tax=Butyricicoccaceae TaxID=3085642 RepID=UPI002479C719|nr:MULTISPECIES: DUF6774 domain-containing protein [Butyricicoccaceae]MCQ5131250.1 hypothetical protein [Butyricicoccus faecihominis]WNX83465.1 DUF6774 domain-containing protein [Agathobaculum sp. NTUH-O15-33]
MDGNQLVAAVTALAISISGANTAADTAMLGLIFTQLGDTLATLAAKRAETETDSG